MSELVTDIINSCHNDCGDPEIFTTEYVFTYYTEIRRACTGGAAGRASAVRGQLKSALPARGGGRVESSTPDDGGRPQPVSRVVSRGFSFSSRGSVFAGPSATALLLLLLPRDHRQQRPSCARSTRTPQRTTTTIINIISFIFPAHNTHSRAAHNIRRTHCAVAQYSGRRRRNTFTARVPCRRSVYRIRTRRSGRCCRVVVVVAVVVGARHPRPDGLCATGRRLRARISAATGYDDGRRSRACDNCSLDDKRREFRDFPVVLYVRRRDEDRERRAPDDQDDRYHRRRDDDVRRYRPAAAEFRLCVCCSRQVCRRLNTSTSTGHVLADRAGAVAVGRGRTDGRIRSRLLDRLEEAAGRYQLPETRYHDQRRHIVGRRRDKRRTVWRQRPFVEFSGIRNVRRRVNQYFGDGGTMEEKHFGFHRSSRNVFARSSNGRRFQLADDFLLLHGFGHFGQDAVPDVRPHQAAGHADIEIGGRGPSGL
ncbi:Hypothetical protein CINCED_3A025166 [Cinara cedri]|uniref:Uncharacterized protein n=1 Tax=Cinara cedri TaxID=506608 RepID=A0A5E4N4U0_9HEMI|nr:Hypothetical protein CINCED_3A025166 [Cinara cedri]